MDNLDRALTTVPAEALEAREGEGAAGPNQDLVNLHDGLRMTERVMMQALAKHGLERYDPAEKEERFDPNLHEASFMAPMQGKEDGAVFTTIQKGFVLNGRVIRVSSGACFFLSRVQGCYNFSLLARPVGKIHGNGREEQAVSRMGLLPLVESNLANEPYRLLRWAW